MKLHLYQQEGLDFFELIYEALKEEYGINTVQSGRFSVPAEAFNPLRNQFDASRIIDALFSMIDKKGELHLLITDVDLYTPRFNFIFGLAEIQRRIAIVSTFRLGANELLRERLVKEVNHEIGHLLGFEHCQSPDCVMYFSNTLDDTDKKGGHLCDICRRKNEKLHFVHPRTN